MTESTDAAAPLWTEFAAHRDRAIRDRLILHYLPLVRYVVGRVASQLPTSLEHADLVSDGVLGLIDAIDRFEPERSVRFEAFATIRIRGAVIDGLRTLDWAPRDLRRRSREIATATAELRAAFGRAPTDREVAARMGMTDERFRALLADLATATIIALDDAVPSGGDGIAGIGDDPAKGGLLAEAVGRLSPRHRTVLRLRYREGLTFTEVGDALRLSQTRAIQLHAEAVAQLRDLLTERDTAV